CCTAVSSFPLHDALPIFQGVQWLSMGGSGFTACFPVYANVTEFPKYFGGTTETVSTDSMYWHSRLIAALTDAHFGNALLFDERRSEEHTSELQSRFDLVC